MIIDEIILYNVGLFRGEQRATLTPCKNRPVVLFGGLNGTGKTTLLEAMQLALFGKQASASRRAGGGYEEYLRKLIHRRVNPKDGASVELQLRVDAQGETQRLRIRRSWCSSGPRVTEHLEVFLNDEFNAVLSESWEEQVGRLLPPQLSGLFFFDGERIEALADPERSGEVLLTAINALLGVDLVAQLETDLIVLDRRKLSQKTPETERMRIEEVEQQLQEAEKLISDVGQEEAHLRAQSGFVQGRIERLDQEFVRQGGHLAEKRQSLEAARKAAEDRIRDLETQLEVLAAGSLPMLLVFERLEQMRAQSRREVEAERAELLHTAISERDAHLLKELKSRVRDPHLLTEVEMILQRDQDERRSMQAVARYLHLTQEGRLRLESLCRQEMAQERARAEQVLASLDKCETELEALDQRIAAVPDPEAIAKLVQDREDLRREKTGIDVQLATTADAVSRLKKDRERLAQKLSGLTQEARQFQLENEDLDRFLKHSHRVRQTLDRFRVAITRQHAARLETFILEGFRKLLRKQSLVSKLQIDPKTCQLTMLDAVGDLLPPERLAAGERQLLAVSILWGLDRACGRPLPVVVDTPLGRLDKSHRTHLVERYFPHASHQVILLSTDEEIDERYLKMLKPHVGHSYRLCHDEKAEGTVIQPGYFWEEVVV